MNRVRKIISDFNQQTDWECNIKILLRICVILFFVFMIKLLIDKEHERRAKIDALPNGWHKTSVKIILPGYENCTLDTIENIKNYNIPTMNVINCSGKPIAGNYICGKGCTSNVQMSSFK